jgi:DNA-binding transcriptional LysR family regulator
MGPDLNLLRVFVAVAEARSFRAAADRLGVTRSAVSQAIRRLEDGLGIALVQRSTRSVRLTEAGARLHRDIAEPLSTIGALHVVPTAAVYCATKYAVRAISDGLRQENDRIRVTCVYPGVVESELADTITDRAAADMMRDYRRIALKPEAIANAIAHAIDQPDDVNTSDIVVRPVAHPA